MKRETKNLLQEVIFIPLLKYIRKNKRQTGTFLRILILFFKCFIIIFSITYGIILALSSVFLLESLFIDILEKLNIIYNNCF